MKRILLAGCCALGGPAVADPLAAVAPVCVAPAQQGGGFDMTCRLVAALLDGSGKFPAPVRRDFEPGGVGALAFNRVVGQDRADPSLLVAFSEGSIYNLALGKYGDRSLDDVRWLAPLALDYGAIVVREDAPWADLQGFLSAQRAAPQRIAVGGGGSILGQDWMRAMMIATEAGIDFRTVRFVAFEGSGGCTEGLVGGFVQACMNDVADARTAIEEGRPLRILAALAPERLPAPLADIPTAREQGIALDWPVLRGLYMGPDVPDAVFDAWRETFRSISTTPEYARALTARHMQPVSMTPARFEQEIAALADTARARAARFGIP